MPGPSKVIVVAPGSGSDARAARQIRLGFAREGLPAEVTEAPAGRDDAGLIVVAGTGAGALERVRAARHLLDERAADTTLLFVGQGVTHGEVREAGADEAVLLPAYLRDVVTLGRLLRGVPASQRAHLVGSLAETTGVYTLVRALCALGRSVVLTLMRGLRRGEVRFYDGEVTSAQVGLIHGQAALHQLLLWTDARFEVEHEEVVRRQQIPLSPEELFADAERFLEGVRDASGQLSPSMVLEQDVPKLHALGDKIPAEVMSVLRMFDGYRVLADVLEDSPYRVFETLRVTQRALDVGLLRIIEAQRPRATWRAVLAIEEWLVGADRDAVLERTRASVVDTGPAPRASEPRGKGSRRKRKKRRANTPLPRPEVLAAAAAPPDIDWGALVPRQIGAEVGAVSGAVPAAMRSGEIELPAREPPREKLETLMDTAQRGRIFPAELGLEPKVVLDEEAPDARGESRGESRDDDRTTPFVREDLEAHAPESIDDEPSDGVVRPIATAETAPLRPPPRELPVDDRPEAQAGEIASAPPPPPESAAAPDEPSVLVADLATAHAAAMAAVPAQLDAPPSTDLAEPADELAISGVRRDAVAAVTAAFTEVEEAFFRAGTEKGAAAHTAPVEKFEDLDEGYQPLGFWDRLRGKTSAKKP